MRKMFNMIFAIDNKGGIGIHNSLPWKYKKDMNYFKKMTMNTSLPNKKNCVIMGRKTWESCGNLKNRMNIVITNKEFDKYKNYVFEEDENTLTYFCKTIHDALNLADKTNYVDKLWVIGGAQIYKECFRHHKLNKVYITKIDHDFNCDTFLEIPEMNLIDNIVLEDELIIDTQNTNMLNLSHLNVNVEYCIYEPMQTAETQYLKLMDKIMENGIEKEGRNGVTKSLINQQLTFDISKSFPLLTTKKMYWKGIVEELLFFLRGDTNTKHLEAKKVNIWKGNTNRKFLDEMDSKIILMDKWDQCMVFNGDILINYFYRILMIMKC